MREEETVNQSTSQKFPFLFGGTFIEGDLPYTDINLSYDFPSFSEGLSLRGAADEFMDSLEADFPSFSEGLSLRASYGRAGFF